MMAATRVDQRCLSAVASFLPATPFWFGVHSFRQIA